MHNAHTTSNTQRRAQMPFLKPGLIFVWIIGLCAYQQHHIGRLKPYYQPIEKEKRFSTSTHSHALTIHFTKTHKHLFDIQQKHTFSSWNTLLRMVESIRIKVLIERAKRFEVLPHLS